MRLDKFLCEMNIGSRSTVKGYIKNGLVSVNDESAIRPELSINPDADHITFKGKILTYQRYAYYMLHKPAGVVTAKTDARDKTVMDIFREILDKEPYKDVFPIGRLDKDTEGLLILTNDGELSHRLLSPEKHIPKTYYVELDKALHQDEVQMLEQGIDIGERKNDRIKLTQPAKVELMTPTTLHLTITEGKFHQIKRMFHALGKQVIYLKRISMGLLFLDPELKKGDCRKLQKEEIDVLLQYK